MAKQNAIANKTFSLLADTTVWATTFDTNVAAAAVTLSGTTLAALGSDAAIDISITPKGIGNVIVSTGVKATTFDTNVAAAALTLSGTTLAAVGSDAAIDITLTPKGAGTEIFSNLSTGAVLSSSTGALSSSGAGTAGQILTAQGGTTIPQWQTNAGGQLATGFATWSAGGPYFDDTTLGSFSVLVGGTGYILGQPITWAAQSVSGMTAGNTYYIYIDNTGTIGKTTTRTDALYINNIVLFECMRDSTPVTNNQVTVAENHPYTFPVETSNYLHDVINTVIDNVANGANITLNGTQGIQINGSDILNDHGVETTISDSGGVAETWSKYYTTAGGKWALQNRTNTFTGYWNSSGTPTALSAGNYGVYTLYASKNNLNSSIPYYFAVLNTAQFANLTQANTAISNGNIAKASGELASLEICQLGYIIYHQSTSSIVSVIISKSTLKQTLSTGSGTTIASLITTNTASFNGILSGSDTNVQAALDTIDNWGASTTNHGVLIGQGTGVAIAATTAGTAGQLLTSSGAAADPTWTTATYPATIAKGDVVIGADANQVGVVATAGATDTYVLTAHGSGTLPTWEAPSGGGGGITFSVITADQSIAADNGYICNKAGTLTLTLPASIAAGKQFEVTGINTATGWKIAQNANQIIHFGTANTTTGATGYLQSTAIRDSVRLVCVVADLEFNVLSSVGNITVA